MTMDVDWDKIDKERTLRGSFISTRSDTVKSFICGHCLKPKTSKNSVQWTKQNETKTICNGCYGELLAKKP